MKHETELGSPSNPSPDREGSRKSGVSTPTDAEIICVWLEPYPATRKIDDLQWHAARYRAGEWEYAPRLLTLDALWEVEERLTEEQWMRYSDYLGAVASVGKRFDSNRPVMRVMCHAIHATAEQKIKALAVVIAELRRAPADQPAPDE